MSVSCAPAVASEIRPTPGGCICPVRLLVAADARRWRRGEAQHPAAAPALGGLWRPFCGMGDFFAQPRGSGASPAGRRDFFDQGGLPLRGRAYTPTLCPLCARTRPQAGKAGRLTVCAIRRPQAAFLASPARERPQRTGEAPPHGAAVSWPCARCALCARPPPRKIFPPCVRKALRPVSKADTPAAAGRGGICRARRCPSRAQQAAAQQKGAYDENTRRCALADRSHNSSHGSTSTRRAARAPVRF